LLSPVEQSFGGERRSLGVSTQPFKGSSANAGLVGAVANIGARPDTLRTYTVVLLAALGVGSRQLTVTYKLADSDLNLGPKQTLLIVVVVQ
jgi:hypothetical protein